jgi:hypothetical protein
MDGLPKLQVLAGAEEHAGVFVLQLDLQDKQWAATHTDRGTTQSMATQKS